MLKIKDGVDLAEFKEYGFKWGIRDRFWYKTRTNGIESMIYIDLVPCHNNNDEIKIECPLSHVPEKITDKLYDLISAGLVEKV